MAVDLETTYLGLALKNPIVASASPLTGHLDSLRQLEEAGAAAVVLPSLFEEQLEREELAVRLYFELGMDQFVKALAEQPELDEYNKGPASYLAEIKRAKQAISIPVIAGLNGAGVGNWARHAALLEEAGADAVELNAYFVPTDPEATAAQVEERYLDVVAAVREAVTIPLAVKLGPCFTSLPNFARRLVEVGADGLVLFNRFVQPDIALETLEINTRLALSTSAEVRLPLRWIAILRPQLSISLAASTGVETTEDLLKLLLVGADVTMTASALLRHGPGYVRNLLDGLPIWLEQKGHRSVTEIKGRLSMRNCPDPSAFERANYLKMIASSSTLRKHVSG
jgi:dihydroorotate dehydrogenase (fumarate)